MPERSFQEIMNEPTVFDKIKQAVDVYMAVEDRKHKRQLEAETVIGQKLRSAISIWEQNPNDQKSIEESIKRVNSVVQNKANMVYGNSPIVNFASDTLYTMNTELNELKAVDIITDDARTNGGGEFSPRKYMNQAPGEARKMIDSRIVHLKNNLDVLVQMKRNDSISVADISDAVDKYERLKKFIGFDEVLGAKELLEYDNTEYKDLKQVWKYKQEQLDELRVARGNIDSIVKGLSARLASFTNDEDSAEKGVRWDPEVDGDLLIKEQINLENMDKTIRLAEVDLKEITYDYTGLQEPEIDPNLGPLTDDPFGGLGEPWKEEEVALAGGWSPILADETDFLPSDLPKPKEEEPTGIVDKAKKVVSDIDIGLSDDDLTDIKKLSAVGAGGYGLSKVPKAIEAVEKYYGRLAKAARYIKSTTELSASEIKAFMNDSQLEKTLDTLEKIDAKKADADANLKGTLSKRRKKVRQGGVKYLAKKYGISEATAGKLLESSGMKKWNVFQYKRNLVRKVPRAISKKLSPYLIGSIITNAVGLESEGLSRVGIDVVTGLGARKTLVTMAKEVTPKLTKMLSTTAGKRALIGYLGSGGARIVAGAVRGGGALSVLSAAASAGLVAYDTYNFIMNWNKEE